MSAETTFPPAYAVDAIQHPTPDLVERYRADAHRVGLAKAREAILDGHLAQAFVTLVETTEAEARITGLVGTRLEAGPGLRRIIAHRRATRAGVA